MRSLRRRSTGGDYRGAIEREPITELDERFSSPGAVTRPWAEIVAVLEAVEIFWLSTVRRDGRPHVTPLPAMWLDAALHFCTGPEEQKAKNLARQPSCVLTTGVNTYRAGLDVVVEGAAVRVSDDALLRRLAEMWEEKLDWSFDVADGMFRERTGDGTPHGADVYAVAPRKVLAFGKGESFSQTRYLFPE